MKKRIANWGNYPSIQANEISFTLLRELKEKLLSLNKGIARGLGRCYGDAALSSTVISTLKHNHILDFDEATGIINVESGISLASLLEFVIPKGWFLPVTPGTKFITVGGALASDVHGKNHHSEGCFRNHVIEVDVINGECVVITCSPTFNKDLFQATAGGMGLTGIITRVKFRLKKIETAYIKQKLIKAKNLNEVIELFEKYSEYTYSVAWIDCLKTGNGFGRSILMLGEHATLEDLPDSLKNNPLDVPTKTSLTLPFYLPSFLLNRFTVAAFNFLFYNKTLKKEVNNIISYEPFFYPLDALHHWNKGYGKKGFVQYQFVLPLEAKEGLIEILKRINNNGLASFLAVLKIFGEDNSLISFPMKGYTLALDIPVRKGLFEFLDELDVIVLKFRGRIYMSKDARMKPNVFYEGYTSSKLFLNILAQHKANKFSSLLSERLNITKL